MKEHSSKEGNRRTSSSGAPGPIQHPAYCTPQCYAKGKLGLAGSCQCQGCRGDAHGRGKKFAFDHGYLKHSMPGSRRPPLDQELLFPDEEISSEQSRSIAIKEPNEIRWISVPLPEDVEPDETVWISVAKFDTSWKKNRSQYIGPSGSGPAIGERYEKFGIWFEKGEAIEIPWVGLEDGEICFTNGRHRFAWLRDHGVKSMPIDVDPAIAGEMRKRFGVDARFRERRRSSPTRYRGMSL
jgi:hypothetical protein